MMGKEVLSEKVSVNINSSTLSSIDLLVDNGYYSNRSDFINQALRESLQRHQSTIDRIIDTKKQANRENPDGWFLGIYGLEAGEVEEARRQGRQMSITGYGVLVIGEDVDENALYQVVESIHVKGKVVCGKRIKEHYGIR